MYKRSSISFLVLLACFTVNNSFSQQLIAQYINNYRVVHWSVQDGLSQDVAYDMIKDVNGFLWIGTQNGLNRFDGRSFKKYFADKTKKTKGISGDIISGLVEDSLYNIWIGTNKGLSRYDTRADSFTNFYSYPSKAIVPFWATEDEVFCWDHQDDPGSQLTAYNIHTFTKRTLVKIFPEDSLGNGIADHYAIFDASSNSIWVEQGLGGTPGGGLLQIHLSTGKKERFGWPCYRNISNHDHSFEGMRYDERRNAIWLSTSDGLIEFSLNYKQFHHIAALDPLIQQKDYHLWAGITIDKFGRIWMGTYPKGIIIYDPAKNTMDHAFPKDSIVQQNVSDANVLIYSDREGMIWTGSWSNKGIYQMIPFAPAVVHYVSDPKHPNSLSTDYIIHCFDAGKNKIWLGTLDGINIFDPDAGLFQVLRRKDIPGLNGTIGSILIAAIDTISHKAWVDVDGTIYQMDMNSRKCVPVSVKGAADTKSFAGGFPTPYKRTCIFTGVNNERQDIFIVNNDSAVAEKVLSFPAGTIDFFKTATDDRLIFLRQPDSAFNLTYALLNDKWVKTPNPLDSIPWKKIIYNKNDRTYWLVVEKMFYHYNSNFKLIHTYTQKDGMPDFDVCGIIQDNRNNIWFNTESSIHLLDIKTGRVTTLSEKDGFKKQGFTPVLNFGSSLSGKLYLPGGLSGQGFNLIDPSVYTQTLSSVYFQSLQIKNKPFLIPEGIATMQELSLKYFENMITIETGIIDFYSKGVNRIRYKLGDNTDWQYQTSNIIHFEKLAPGNYKLLVQSSNASNEFAGPEKILLINISPPFWQTLWFKILVGISLLLLFYGSYRWRTATLRKQKRKLEQTVKERTAEVVAEKAEVEKQKAKSDELLLNILPFEVAEELKEKGYTTAKSFDEVSILFSDIKGFTHVAEKMTAQELVKEIDTYFSTFDKIMQHYGLEKIKTIGDAYIAAGGLPEENTATTQNVVEAAIAMQKATEELKKIRIENNLPYFELRIGIHTGPVVAGVVGIKKFQYDIWGDTVNIAARMEQSGLPGRINISQNTYEKVKKHFACTHRGKIEAKNKGEVDMYFVK